MGSKTKGGVLFLIPLVSFMLMVETKYFGCIGDKLLNYLCLGTYSGGFHVGLLFYLIPFMFSVTLMRYFFVLELKVRTGKLILAFIVCVFIMNKVGLQMVPELIKAQSDGLKSIEYEYEYDNYIEIDTNDEDITKFEAQVALKNHSNEIRKFYISIPSSLFDKECTIDNDYGYIAYNRDKSYRELVLKPKENATFDLVLINNSDNMTFIKGMGSKRSIPSIIIFTEDEGIKLHKKRLFGTSINRM